MRRTSLMGSVAAVCASHTLPNDRHEGPRRALFGVTIHPEFRRRNAIENLAFALLQTGRNRREPSAMRYGLRRVDAFQALAQLFRGKILRAHRGRHIAGRLHDERGILWPHDEIHPLVSGLVGPALGG